MFLRTKTLTFMWPRVCEIVTNNSLQKVKSEKILWIKLAVNSQFRLYKRFLRQFSSFSIFHHFQCRMLNQFQIMFIFDYKFLSFFNAAGKTFRNLKQFILGKRPSLRRKVVSNNNTLCLFCIIDDFLINWIPF